MAAGALGAGNFMFIEAGKMSGDFPSRPLLRKTLRCAVSIVTAALGTTAAFGQDTTTRAVTEVAFTLDGLYQSNVAQASADLADQRGLHRSDFRVTPGVQLTLLRPFGRNTLRLSALAGYDFNLRNPGLNRERLGLDGEAGLNFGRCLVSLRPSIQRQQSDLSQIYYLDTPTIDSVKNTETVQVYAADVRCGRKYGLRPIVGYEHSIGDNSNDLRSISDYRGNRYFGGLGYNNPSIANFNLTYEHNRVEYPHRANILSPTTLPDQYHGSTIRFEAERDMGVLLTLKGSIAYFTVDSPGTNVPDFNGIGWRIEGTVHPTTRLQVALTTEHQPQPSLGAEALYSIDSNYGALATFALTSRTSLFLGADYDKRDYRGATGVFGPELSEDALIRVRGGASLALTSRFKVTAEAGHEKRNANQDIYDYSNTFIGLGVRYAL